MAIPKLVISPNPLFREMIAHLVDQILPDSLVMFWPKKKGLRQLSSKAEYLPFIKQLF